MFQKLKQLLNKGKEVWKKISMQNRIILISMLVAIVLLKTGLFAKIVYHLQGVSSLILDIVLIYAAAKIFMPLIKLYKKNKQKKLQPEQDKRKQQQETVNSSITGLEDMSKVELAAYFMDFFQKLGYEVQELKNEYAEFIMSKNDMKIYCMPRADGVPTTIVDINHIKKKVQEYGCQNGLLVTVAEIAISNSLLSESCIEIWDRDSIKEIIESVA